jgi:hypothetical protein
MYKRALMANDSFDLAQVVQQDIDAQLEKMAGRLLARQFGQPGQMGNGRMRGNLQEDFWDGV